MARIRKIEIKNFRCVQELSWVPSSGINCLIGPGDSGKSTILDAIDLCLGARRNAVFTDADFHKLNVTMPISISVTIGELDDGLMRMDAYGMFLRGFDSSTGELEDEPERDAETVLTVQLNVESDLEPAWRLVSERAAAQGLTRNLIWADRVRLAPTRIGTLADYNLSWRRGSVLNRVSEEKADTSAALAKAARDVRTAFGDQVEVQLTETLKIVAVTAKELGISVGDTVKALLDAHSVSFNAGTIALHDEDGVPLRGLGDGSIRLLIAGLQGKVAQESTMILIDEVEYGLEPHRIMRFISSLGAKEENPPLQAFMTTHSPAVLRELSGNQLFVVRGKPDKHDVRLVGKDDDIQSTVRLHPEAFLAPSVSVVEGATEVGLVRGIDRFRTSQGKTAIAALGVALVDGAGGDKIYKRATSFMGLEYRTAVLRDDDTQPTPDLEKTFKDGGGKVITWRAGRTLEDELFLSLSKEGVGKLIDWAIEIHGKALINDHIKTTSAGKFDLVACRGELTKEIRDVLGKASRIRKAGWFKSVTWMEAAAFNIIGPDLRNADSNFRALIEEFFVWANDAPR
jgi:putative ATP-dependent endonuclease of OLD family